LTSVALYRNNQADVTYFWLFDSHSREPKGYKAPTRGVSCCKRFKNIRNLYEILCRNLTTKTGNVHTVNIYILISLEITQENIETEPREEDTAIESRLTKDENSSLIEKDINEIDIRAADSIAKNAEIEVVFTTNMLHSIDDRIPNVESVITIDDGNLDDGQVRLIDVRRKIASPLNIERERRMEELDWYFLFPDGKNGFGEQREIPIIPLDYFQARVIGSDRRFQRTDYIFFALSIVEYIRAKASVSVSCRMRQEDHTPQGLIDNMHLIMRNIRGSASYWR